jgi:choline-sulfatase
MVRQGDWKYVFMANGGREQLFHLGDDPNELNQRLHGDPAVADRLRNLAVDALRGHGCEAGGEGARLRAVT